MTKLVAHCLFALSVLLLLSSGSVWAKQPSVVFLNPGSSDDIGVWRLVSNFMRPAADQLGIQLEILYADRDHLKMLEQAESVSQRSGLPDYVVLVNEKQSGVMAMSFFKNSPVKIMLLHNDLTQQQRDEAGNERGLIKNWIGTLTTDEYKVSLLLIKALSSHCSKAVEAVGLSGIKSNPVSLEREAGLGDFFLDPTRGRLLQIVHADWSYAEGKDRAARLLERYPDLNVIWAANDAMAVGALDAAKEAGKGTVIAIGGQGGFPAALERIRSGELKATVGGTAMTGAWALVLLYDYHHGLDFANDVGLHYKPDHATVIDSPEKAKKFGSIVIEHPDRIDFRSFSKVFTPKLEHYDFRYEKVLEAAGETPAR